MTTPEIRHPRRLGFTVFNLLVLSALAAWILLRPQPGEVSVADVPNLTVTTAGVGVLLTIWAGAWVAWGIMVLRRRIRLRNTARA